MQYLLPLLRQNTVCQKEADAETRLAKEIIKN